MKKVLLAIILLLSVFHETSRAQLTLVHQLNRRRFETGIVNLAISGKKIISLNSNNFSHTYPDTFFFYNMDYSLWKQVICPQIAGYNIQCNFLWTVGTALGVFYPSETFYNTDTNLEVGVFYLKSSDHSRGNFYVINEHGVLTDSISDLDAYSTEIFRAYADTSGSSTVWKLIVPMVNGTNFYTLPGSLPCETCSVPPTGISQVDDKNKDILSQPNPNPSGDLVNIVYTLPKGVSVAELILYNNNGIRVKTYKVTNQFTYITLDNSQLPSGLYYYNIVANGNVSSTHKIAILH
jgi:hypothetical protein